MRDFWVSHLIVSGTVMRDFFWVSQVKDSITTPTSCPHRRCQKVSESNHWHLRISPDATSTTNGAIGSLPPVTTFFCHIANVVTFPHLPRTTTRTTKTKTRWDEDDSNNNNNSKDDDDNDADDADADNSDDEDSDDEDNHSYYDDSNNEDSNDGDHPSYNDEDGNEDDDDNDDNAASDLECLRTQLSIVPRLIEMWSITSSHRNCTMQLGSGFATSPSPLDCESCAACRTRRSTTCASSTVIATPSRKTPWTPSFVSVYDDDHHRDDVRCHPPVLINLYKLI